MFIGIALWGKLPDTIATHFGADNVANGWSSKPFTRVWFASDFIACAVGFVHL